MESKSLPYKWTLKDAVFTKDKGTVFSCFSCGGGSSMGYKLAGFDVIGCNEIDPRPFAAYKKNFNPKYSFIEGIQTFKTRTDLPEELFHLDILDGSPPCSSFSMAGSRDDDWGVEKKFREGQVDQVLDTLFFDYIDVAKLLQPKVVVAENVKGLLLGEAIDYVRRIYKAFDDAGYYCQHFLFNAADLGVPQRRERVFFICLRKDLAGKFMHQADLFTQLPLIRFNFNEKNIVYGEFRAARGDQKGITPYIIERMNQRIFTDKSIGDINMRVYNKLSMFNNQIVYDHEVLPTITSSATMYRNYDVTTVPDIDLIHAGTFPEDYDFAGNQVQYLVGMSVPPVMVARIITEVYNQWLKFL